MQRLPVRTRVNGVWMTGSVEPRRTLADFLREDLGLTGTHVGCEHGVCGACTVLVDGEAVRSCLLFAVQADGKDLRTIEGLATNGVMSPLQEAMAETHAFQCGFCTPGFLMTLTALMEERPEGASRPDIREYLSGNICRCSGYQTIVDGVELAFNKCQAKASLSSTPTSAEEGL
jgi:aerobic carbon-monoxide dehydrogenase small subunit